MLEVSGDKRMTLVQSVLQVIDTFKNESITIVDLTGQDEIYYISAEEKVQYIKEISPLSKDYRHIAVNQNKSSFINQLKLSEQALKETSPYIDQITLTTSSDLIMIDSQLVWAQAFKEIDTQKDILSLIFSDKLKKHFYAVDRPFYCSALSDKCTASAKVLRSNFQPYIFNSAEAARPLVVSGNADTYERTFPKFDSEHQGYEDPTMYEDPEFPIFINLNGLKQIPEHQQWLLQKQQWSAYMRKILTFGVLTLTANQSETDFTTYDINGRVIDELSIVFSDKTLSFIDQHASFIAYTICISISVAFLKLSYSSFIPRLAEHSRMIQDQIKGIERERDGREETSSDECEADGDSGEECDNLSGHKSGEGEDSSKGEHERTTEIPLNEIEMTEIGEEIYKRDD